MLEWHAAAPRFQGTSIQKGRAFEMKRFLLLFVLGLGCSEWAHAQETTGPKAEAVKKEIQQLEEQKLEAFRSTGTDKNICADWVKANDAENIVHINADGTDDTK